MGHETLTDRQLDYYPCNYGRSRLVFRGPRKRLGGDFLPILGGSETYGRYVEDPYPDLLEEILGTRTINFGYLNAGLDVFLNDPTVLDACAQAQYTVLQITGAQNLSNRFYAVHPRRNDRFVRASAMMKAVYPEVDFTEFHFNRHMLSVLEDVSRDRFSLIRDELRKVWMSRTNQLTAKLPGEVILLWIAKRSPDDPGEFLADGDPPFVTRRMIEGLRGRIAGVVEHLDEDARSLQGKVFAPDEAPIAKQLPGPAAHDAAAAKLAKVLTPLLGRT